MHACFYFYIINSITSLFSRHFKSEKELKLQTEKLRLRELGKFLARAQITVSQLVAEKGQNPHRVAPNVGVFLRAWWAATGTVRTRVSHQEGRSLRKVHKVYPHGSENVFSEATKGKIENFSVIIWSWKRLDGWISDIFRMSFNTVAHRYRVTFTTSASSLIL